MADKNLRIKVSTKGAKKASQDLGGVDNRLKGLARSAAGAAAGFFGARMLISGFKEAIRLAGIQEQAEKRLAVALGGTSQALLKQATALQQVTTFGDESIIGVQASIAAFVKNEDQIKKATEATLDMAVAMGMDLKGAGDLIAKTLGSSTNALSRYGIQVEGAVGSTERLESLTANVAKLFGGQAKAQALTMAGAIEQAKNAMGDAAEEIGTALGPAIVSIAKELKFVAGFWAEWTGRKNDDSKSAGPVIDQIKAVNEEIKVQADLIAYQTSPAYADLTAKRAEFNELTIFEQVAQDTILLNANTETLDKLNKKKSTLLKLKKEDLGVAKATPDIIREEIKFTAKLIDVNKKLGESIPDEAAIKAKKEKMLLIQEELKQAALVQGSAEDAMKAVVRAESMEAAAGYISGLFQSFHPLVALVMSAGAGAVVSKAIDRGLASFAEGGDFVTSGPKMMMVGDNPGGRERVQVTPLSSPNVNGPQGGITINVSAPLVDETVIDSIIPAIKKAQRFDLA